MTRLAIGDIATCCFICSTITILPGPSGYQLICPYSRDRVLIKNENVAFNVSARDLGWELPPVIF